MGLKTGIRGALLGSALALSAFSGAEADPVYKVIHNFAGPPNDGADPKVTLTSDSAGNLYGTTRFGGAVDCDGTGYGCGTVFKVAPDGTETVLHSFAGADAGDGAHPLSPVTADPSNGDLYGTTFEGGASSQCSDCGTIWKIAADGTYTVLHSFDGTNDGGGPIGRLIEDKFGNFYGVVGEGPGDERGGVFRYSAADGLNVLVLFNGLDGVEPDSLAMDKTGNFYGTTFLGGSNGTGTVFELTSGEYIFRTLLNFGTSEADYNNPIGGLAFDKDGNVYGTAEFNAVFRLAPDGTATALHLFTGPPDGSVPCGDILRVGKALYGTTISGGANNDGAIFKITPGGTETVLHTFSGSDGAAPYAGLVKKKHDGLLYGTTESGGAYGHGVVFSVTKK